MYSYRLQVLLDGERHDRLKQLAAERGVSVGSLVREAIDRGLAQAPRDRAGALRRLLASPAMTLPADPADLKRCSSTRSAENTASVSRAGR
jgi:Ribbon-helix-helix protein, copG family